MSTPFPIPLNAIRAIEIVARRGALAPAAEELGVTVGAVSQHIRRAEERLGIALFERTPQGLRATAQLRAVLPQLSGGFQSLADAMAALTPRHDNRLTLTVGAVFASRWLVWRLGRFTAAHPEIEVRLVVSAAMVDFRISDIDCGIRYGTGPWEGVAATRIGGETYRPVAAPALAARLSTPADLAKVPVIHDLTTMLSWEAWFAASGHTPPQLSGPSLTDPALAFDAAVSGQGVLLTVDMMAMDAVRDGRLVWPFETSVRSEQGYWFVTPAGRRDSRPVRLFREWLAAEAKPQSSA